MKKKEEKTLLWKLKRQNQGLGLTRQMVGTVCRRTVTQIFPEEYRQQVFKVVV